MPRKKSMQEAKDRVLTVLYRTECIRCNQVPLINFNNVVSTAVARQLTNEQLAFYSKEKDILLKYPRTKPNMAVINCLDVLLKFILNIDIENIYKPDGCTDLGFTRHNKNFELLDIRKEEYLKNKIKEVEEEYSKRLDMHYDNTRYIFCVPNESYVDIMPEDVNFPYAFAVVKRYNGEEKMAVPDIYFITINQDYEDELDELTYEDEEDDE